MEPPLKRGRGRPSAYKPEYARIAREFAKLGATEAQIALGLGVSTVTLWKWKAAFPDFVKAIKVGKASADSAMERSLYHRGIGYSHDEVDIRVVDKRIVKTKIIRHYPPDPTAMIFWLSNRQPDRWKRNRTSGNEGDDKTIEVINSPDA